MRDANRRTQSVRRSRRAIEEAILSMRNTSLGLRPADSTHETNQLRSGDAGWAGWARSDSMNENRSRTRQAG